MTNDTVCETSFNVEMPRLCSEKEKETHRELNCSFVVIYINRLLVKTFVRANKHANNARRFTNKQTESFSSINSLSETVM